MAATLRFQHYEVASDDAGKPVELGRGAMGITYRAFDTSLRREVALKVINRQALQGDAARERFFREARAAAAIRHPNVAAAYHLGTEGDDVYYAMELIDGETVEEHMKREGAIPAAQALEIASQVARALAAAEKVGLVHRDIKPANIMLASDAAGDLEVKVIDFGLAKPADGGGASGATITAAGFLGTPHFASPEQLEERELDTRSDIYSLGVTLYYMLAGRTPFSGSLAQVMSQHLNREPPLDMLRGQPVCVLALLRRMMAKDPSCRPQTAADLRELIEATLAELRSAPSADPPVPAAAVEEADDLMDTAALAPAEAPGAFVPEAGAVLAGRFELLDEYEPGPHGRTFRARNIETGGTVAVMVLDPGLLATREAYTRFEDEITALQAAKHPSVIRVESIERAHQITWVTREWVDAPSLESRIAADGPLRPAQAAALAEDLAGGLDALQRAGISCPGLEARWIVVDDSSGTPQPRFNPLDLGGAAASRSRDARPGIAYAAALAGVLRSVLGESGVARLPQAAADALRRAADPSGGFRSAGEFADAFAAGAAAAGAAAASPRPEAARRSRALPLAFLALAAVVVSAGAAWILLPSVRVALDAGAPRTADATEVEPAEDPALGAIPPEPEPEPSPEPEPEPEPVDPRVVAYENALDRAEERLLADDYAAVFGILADLAAEYPENRPEVVAAIERAAAKLRADHPQLPPDLLESLREPLEEAAVTGSVSAQMVLADSLADDDPEAAFKFYLLAAEDGNSEAMIRVGEMYHRGRGTDLNREQKFHWFKRAADLGEPLAMLGVGEAYFFGDGTPRDVATAIPYFTMAAAYGDPAAMTHLAEIYRKALPGSGLERPNYREAHRLLAAATELGFLDAQGNLGVMIINGEVVDGEAVEGDPDPSRADAVLASRLFKDGAEQDNALCALFWARCLEFGLGIAEQNPSAARAAYIRAAELGNADAQEWCRRNRVRFRPPGSAE